MKGLVSSCLFGAFGGSVNDLMSGGEGAGHQHFNLLGVTNFSTGIDHFLSCLLEFLGQLSKLEDLSFDEWVT